MYQTIRQTVRSEGISETALRRMVKAGFVPGFYSGVRFYVNVEKLREQLAKPNAKQTA